MLTTNLQDAFQRYARKIVSVEEIDSLTLEYAEMYLLPDQLEAYCAAGGTEKSKPQAKAAAEKMSLGQDLFLPLVAKVGDGTSGIYQSAEEAENYFVSIARLAFGMEKRLSPSYPQEIHDTVMSCYAKAIAEAQDYRPALKSGALKPVTTIH